MRRCPSRITLRACGCQFGWQPVRCLRRLHIPERQRGKQEQVQERRGNESSQNRHSHRPFDLLAGLVESERERREHEAARVYAEVYGITHENIDADIFGRAK